MTEEGWHNCRSGSRGAWTGPGPSATSAVGQGFDALIFDLDGTLWDAAAASAYGWNQALQKLGWARRVRADDIRSVSGRPLPECVATLLPEWQPLDAAVISLIDEHERQGLEVVGGRLYPGIAEGLRALADCYPLFVVSNCPAWYLDIFLRDSGLKSLFRAWDCYGVSGATKGAMLAKLCEQQRLQRPIYVGDTQRDFEAATAAGLEFAFVKYGFGQVASAPLSFASFPELVQWFLDKARQGKFVSPCALDSKTCQNNCQ